MHFEGVGVDVAGAGQCGQNAVTRVRTAWRPVKPIDIVFPTRVCQSRGSTYVSLLFR